VRVRNRFALYAGTMGDVPASAGFEAWRAAYGAATLRDADFETMSGVPLDPVYGPEGDPPDAVGWPGAFPYTRGPYASMYRSKLWTMRMFAGFGTAEDTNLRFRDLLAAGGDGLSVAYDLPTLMGRDSDDPMCEGEVGRCGVAVDTLADTEDLFRGIDLGATTTSMTTIRLRRCASPCTWPPPRRPAPSAGAWAGPCRTTC